MIVIQEPRYSSLSTCSYIPERQWRFEYFFAVNLTELELNRLLERGWRKFGAYFFRPACEGCRECIPIRVRVSDFKPSRSQKRVLRKCSEVRVEFNPLRYRDEIYEIYRDHSINRFGRVTDNEDFLSSFYTKSCPSVQSEYYINGKLAAIGFLDIASEGLSTVYFAYKTEVECYSPGTYSILKEIEYAAMQSREYYYLGYYIRRNSSMAYKNSFLPNEKYDWNLEKWEQDLD